MLLHLVGEGCKLTATAVAFYATGFGARASLLSLVTTWFPEQLRARLYSTIFLVEQLGMLSGEPLLQNVFASALELSRFWHGLPFLCSGVSPSKTRLVDMADD